MFQSIVRDEFMISVAALTEIFYDKVCNLSMEGQVRREQAWMPHTRRHTSSSKN